MRLSMRILLSYGKGAIIHYLYDLNERKVIKKKKNENEYKININNK